MDIKDVNTVKLGVIGCGKMASAILGGVYKNKFLDSSNVIVFDINNGAKYKLVDLYGFKCANSIEELVLNCDVILLAVKPFVVSDVLDKIKTDYKNQLILSILAGVKIEKYLSFLKNAKIVRIMPNTPALVNEGMSALCHSSNVSNIEFEFAYSFMKNCGKVIKTTEDKIDIITALSGSGPAFYFRIIDLMAKSAKKLGLSYEEAILLSSQTALGSAKMIMENNFDVEQLIVNVTTPKGCTEVGNNVLNNSNIDLILDETIEKTMQRAIELG